MTFIRNRRLGAASVAAVLSLAACSGSGTSPQTPTQANVASSVLQFAVGTANVYGDFGAAGGHTGLNVATTYRQPAGALHAGDSAVLVSSPTLTLPGTLTGAVGATDPAYFDTILTGPSATEQGGHAMTATPQTGTTPTTFGRSGGAFGLGLAPFNYNEGGSPDAVAPYVVPLYDSVASDPNAFIPWGGPPAFDPAGDGTGVRDESVPAGTLGVPEGLDVFAGVAPVVGSYQLSIAVPANNGTTTQTATASLSNATTLGAFVLPTPVLDGSGGATVAVTLPAGVTEAYVQITDVGPPASTKLASCNGSDSTPTYYTLFTRASGTLTLPPTDATNKAPSLCTAAQNTAANSGTASPGDDFVVQLVGFDYPWFEASYPNSSGNPSPTIRGASGQSDITISSAAGFSQPASSAGAAVRTKLVLRRSLGTALQRR